MADRRSQAALVFRSIQAHHEGQSARASELLREASLPAVVMATLAVGQQLAGLWDLSRSAAFAEVGRRLRACDSDAAEQRATVQIAEYFGGLEDVRAVDTQALRKGGMQALAGLVGLCEAGGSFLAGDTRSVAEVCDSLALEVALLDTQA